MPSPPLLSDSSHRLLWKIASCCVNDSGGGGGAGVSSFNGRTGAVTLAFTDVEDALGCTPECVSNKSTDGTFAANSDILYPSQKAAKTYADTKLALTGGVLSGDLDISTNIHLDTTGASLFNGTMDLSANFIVGVLDPVNPQDAATKAYVDTAGGAFVLKAGDTMSGDLDIAGGVHLDTDGSASFGGGTTTISTTGSIDINGGQILLPSVGDAIFQVNVVIQGTLDMLGQPILNVFDPVNPQDAATKAYVDAATAGGPFQPLDADLTAIAALATTGFSARTAANTWALRTIVGTANQVIVTNGDGVVGNPTLSLPQSIATSSTVQFGRLGLGVAATTALLQLAAGTTGAGTAPIKLTSGSLLTAAEVGAVEFLTDKAYFTITTGAARKEIALLDAALAVGQIAFATTTGRLVGDSNWLWDNTLKSLSVGLAITGSQTRVLDGIPETGALFLRPDVDLDGSTIELIRFGHDGSSIYGGVPRFYWDGSDGRLKFDNGVGGAIDMQLVGDLYARNFLSTASGSAASPSFANSPGSSTGFYFPTTASVAITLSGVKRFEWTDSTVISSPAAATSGAVTHFLLTGAAHTAQTASTEVVDVNWNLARTVQHSTGALATQRAFVIQAPTYSFVGASTITNAATLAISAAPVAGTNATITNSYALWVQSGGSLFSGPLTIGLASALVIPSGTDTRAGNATLVAGTVTVSNTTVTVNSLVLLTRKTSGGTLGTAITYTLSAGASFTINSDSALDTSTFSYFIIERP